MTKFSFLLPTRGRPELVNRFFQSILDTAWRVEDTEIVLAVDDDDLESQNITCDELTIKKVVLPRGSTMGSLNRACFEASCGRYVMLINDDVIIRTKGWDRIIYSNFARYEDDIALIHVNDLLFREKLCTFPLLSRRACLTIGVCPAKYRRYRIDDHIYDTYNILAHLGHKRIVYLEGVVFEHENYAEELSPEDKGHTAHTFESADRKVYLPNQEIIKQDARFFEETLEQRKNDALRLASLIDQHRYDQQQAVYQSWLRVVRDPFSYRRSDFVTKVSAAVGDDSRDSVTVTVAVVTSDIYKSHAQKCLSLLKKHTSNFDLIILDNNNSPDFNHAREMNKVLQTVKTDFLVLMDDDVFVEAGWLEGLLKSVDAETGIVTPLHKNKRGDLSYSGVYLKGDGLGTHTHTVDKPDQPRVIQCICSAVVLIDMKKCGDILFNTAYQKYFLDLDYGLRVWEAGYKVVCTPEAVVTHLGGGTMVYTSAQSQLLAKQDAASFVDVWIKSGRLAKIEETIWSRFEYLQLLSAIPKEINRIFEEADNWEFEQFEQAINAMVETIQPFGLFQNLMVTCLLEYASSCRSKGRFPRAEYCEDWVSKLTREPVYVRVPRLILKKLFITIIRLINANRHTRRFALATTGKLKLAFDRYQRLPGSIRNIMDRPVFKLKNAYEHVLALQQPINASSEWFPRRLLGAYKGYNLVVYKRRTYGIPASLGPVDLTRKEDRNHPIIVVADALEEVKDLIDKAILLSPRLLGAYKGYNLVDYKRRIYGLPTSLESVDLTREENRNWPGIIVAETLQETKDFIDQAVDAKYLPMLIREALHRFRCGGVRSLAHYALGVLRVRRQFYVAKRKESRNRPEPLAEKKQTVERKREDFRTLIDTALSSNGSQASISHTVPELIEAGYKGFNIFLLEGRYFASPQEEGTLDIELMRANEYSWWSVGHTLPEVKREIDQAFPEGFSPSLSEEEELAKERALFMCNVSPKKIPTFLNQLQSYDVTLLAPKRNYNRWPDYVTLTCLDAAEEEARTLDIANTSPPLLQALKEQNFDLVIIPYEGRTFWKDTNLERFATAITNRVMFMFLDGQTRLYQGEDIRRIQYHKAYLNSMFRFVPPLQGKRVLEVGCSDGLACDLLLSEDPEGIVGMDIMEAVGCKYRDPKIIYVKMDASKLLFEDNTFDLCFSIATLEHCQDPFAVLQEMKRVTKKGGYCYVQAGPLYYSPFGHHMFGYFDDYPWIHLRLTKDEIVDHCKRNGIDEQIQRSRGMDVRDYVYSMINSDHVNGKTLQEYHLAEFIESSDIEVLSFSRSYEGKNIITKAIINELQHIPKEDLVSHGFELIFIVK